MRTRTVHLGRLSFVALSGAILYAACAPPTIPEGRFACDDLAGCPSGFDCGADGLCYRADGSGGGAGGGGGPDAGTGGGTGGGGGIDGGDPCAPAGDYVESLVDANDSTVGGAVEATGLELATAWQTIAGCIETNEFSHASKTDRDGFTFAVPEGTTVWADFHLVRDAAQTSTFVAELRQGATIWPIVSNVGTDQYPAPIPLEPGDYELVVIDVSPDVVTAPYGYAIAMRTVPCEPPGSIDYGEGADGLDSRGNDVLTFSYDAEGIVSVTATSAVDAPEASVGPGLVVEPGTPRRFHGTLALVTSDGDAYLDRDAFRIVTSSNVRALVFQFALSSPDLVDLFVVEDQNEITGASVRTASFGAQSPSAFQALAGTVASNGSYLFWVGKVDRNDAADVEVGYDVTVCAVGF